MAPGSPFSPAPERKAVAPQRPSPRPPTPGGSWLASQGRLPLAFMGLGLGWLVVAAGLTALHAPQFAYPHLVPPIVAIAHAWILGFFVTVAMGAVYQLAPVALGTLLRSERAAWVHLGLHGAGVPAMVFGFWRWDFLLLGTGATLVVGGAALFAVNTAWTVWRSGKRDAVAWSLVLAAAWLLATTSAGLLLVANRRWGWWPLDSLALLRAHAHLGLVGFFLTLLQGVTFRLVPMFTLGDVPNWKPVRLGLWCTQLGLLGLAPALAVHAAGASVAAGSLIVVGLVASAVALRQTLATRKKRQLDHGLRALVTSGAMLGVTALLGLWLAAPTTTASSAPGGLSGMVYGLLVVGGVLLPAIAGMMGKIVPFLTWMRAYGPKVGRVPTPPATALTKPAVERAALLTLGGAVAVLLVGAWTLRPTPLLVGGSLLLVGALLFLTHMAFVLRHLWRPVFPATQPTRS